MPNVGDLVKGTVFRILDTGALISLGQGKRAFLPINEVSEAFVKRGKIGNFIKAGEEYEFRVTKLEKFRDRDQWVVSLVRVDLEGFHKRRFENKMTRFMKSSQEIQSQIRKNNDRKHGTLKMKKKK